MIENEEVIRAWIRGCLKAQDAGETLTPDEHQRLIGYVDRGLLGMDGFRYCWPEEAKRIYEWMAANGDVRSARKIA